MKTIIDLAKQCSCDPTTIRKWVKKNKVLVKKSKAPNGKTVQSLSENQAKQFEEYWLGATTLPENMITIREIAEEHSVDRKTVRLWVKRNRMPVCLLRNSSGPPVQAISIEASELFSEEYSSKNTVPVSEILDEYKTDWRVVKRWAKRNNCEFTKTKSDKGGRAKFSLMKRDAKELRKYLVEVKSDGFFYLIQPVPELDLNRIKLGFTKDPNRRLKEHKSVCPNAKLVKKWKCKKDDEIPVIKKATHNQCKRLHTKINNKRTATEVFDCENYHDILKKLDEIFQGG